MKEPKTRLPFNTFVRLFNPIGQGHISRLKSSLVLLLIKSELAEPPIESVIILPFHIQLTFEIALNLGCITRIPNMCSDLKLVKGKWVWISYLHDEWTNRHTNPLNIVSWISLEKKNIEYDIFFTLFTQVTFEIA